MGMRDRLGHPRHQPRDRRRLVPVPALTPAQVLALDQLHAVIEHPLVLAAVQDRDDMGVVQRGDRFGLAAEQPDVPVVGHGAGLDHLERHQAVEPLLAGLEDDAHAAGAQLLEQQVIAEGGPRSRRRQAVGFVATPLARPDGGPQAGLGHRLTGLGRRGHLRVDDRTGPVRRPVRVELIGHRPGDAIGLAHPGDLGPRLPDRGQLVGGQVQEDPAIGAALPVVGQGRGLPEALAQLLVEHHQLEPERDARLSLQVAQVVLDPWLAHGPPIRFIPIANPVDEPGPLVGRPGQIPLVERDHRRMLPIQAYRSAWRCDPDPIPDRSVAISPLYLSSCRPSSDATSAPQEFLNSLIRVLAITPGWLKTIESSRAGPHPGRAMEDLRAGWIAAASRCMLGIIARISPILGGPVSWPRGCGRCRTGTAAW